MSENKNLARGVMGAVTAELLVPTQETAGARRTLVERPRALSVFAFLGPPKVSHVSMWCATARTASLHLLTPNL